MCSAFDTSPGDCVPPWVLRYIGAPYAPGGRDLARGVDCFGLVVAVLEREFGVTVREPTAPGDWVPVTGPLAVGDVLAYRRAGGQLYVGIFVGADRFLHAWEGTGVVHGLMARWQRRLVGVYRHRDVTGRRARQVHAVHTVHTARAHSVVPRRGRS